MLTNPPSDPGPDRGPGRRRPREIEELLRELESRAFRSAHEAQRFLEQGLRRYNERPQRELGGLSPLQVARLVEGDWATTGALRLDRSLSFDALAGSDFLHNARLFLAALGDAGTVKPTAAGNLPRTFVAELLGRLRWPAGLVDDVHRVNRVVNEEDVFPLHVLRHVLVLAGLMRRHKGFRLTTAGRELLAEARAGELFARLFVAFFRRLNLAYLDGAPPHAGLQQTIAFPLLMLAREAASWVTPGQLAPRVWLTDAADPPTALEEKYGDLAPIRTGSRLLKPLVAFGLLESRDRPGVDAWHRPYEVRKTALFDRFLHFDLDSDRDSADRLRVGVLR